MKKTLCRKVIKGHGYYYLAYRKGGRLHSSYLGKIDGLKFKKYLYEITSSMAYAGLELSKKENFFSGLPVVYSRNGFLIYEYKNGVKELRDKKDRIIKVVLPNE